MKLKVEYTVTIPDGLNKKQIKHYIREIKDIIDNAPLVPDHEELDRDIWLSATKPKITQE